MNLEQLIDYDSWANEAIQHVLSKNDLSYDEYVKSCFSLFHHILAAQMVWHDRVMGFENKLGVWPKLKPEEVEKMIQDNPVKLRELISLKEKIITYSNSKGDTFKNSVEEILTHIIIHGQHHRAQIALVLRQNGITPPATDLIFYLRNR